MNEKKCAICEKQFETEFPKVIHWCCGKCRTEYVKRLEEKKSGNREEL